MKEKQRGRLCVAAAVSMGAVLIYFYQMLTHAHSDFGVRDLPGLIAIVLFLAAFAVTWIGSMTDWRTVAALLVGIPLLLHGALIVMILFGEARILAGHRTFLDTTREIRIAGDPVGLQASTTPDHACSSRQQS